MPYLRMKNINKIYPGNVQAVFDFNLDVEKGDFIVMVGPSGCGKSTVLRMIAGLEEISTGDMELEGERINDMAPSDRKIAMVFQDYALYGNMTVYQNIGFSLTIQGVSSDTIHERVMEVSKIVELKDYLKRFPRNLSGGQRQRVAMGRSLAKHAKILLMDEPLSNLDAKLRQQTRMELAVLHSQLKPTIIYVTHDQIEAMTLASRIVVMNEGQVQQIGSPYEIYNYPANIFTASFIGAPPINIVCGLIEGEGASACFAGLNKNKEIAFRCSFPGELAEFAKSYIDGGIMMGIRPETIRLRIPDETVKQGEAAFDAKVEALELLGAEYHVKLNIEDCELTGRIPVKEKLSLGQRLEVVCNINKTHFFDERTGLRLKAPSAGQDK